MSAKDAGKFIGVLFLSRTIAHQFHLSTESFAQHKALNDFYDAIPALADSISEQWQGEFEELLEIPILSSKDVESPIKYLKTTLKWIKDTRYSTFDKEDSALQNDIDEVVKLFRSTIYKLKFLK